MRIMIASDIHGSSYYVNELLKAYEKEQVGYLCLLGDIYNHGPRNPLPREYAPLIVAELLNSIRDKLIVVRGNCDSAVDEKISYFDILENSQLIMGQHRVFLTHGHIYNREHMPALAVGDILFQGHTHESGIWTDHGVTIVNPGAISIPKGNGIRSYAILTETEIAIKCLEDGKTLFHAMV